jgi:hypothetical protein
MVVFGDKLHEIIQYIKNYSARFACDSEHGSYSVI